MIMIILDENVQPKKPKQKFEMLPWNKLKY